MHSDNFDCDEKWTASTWLLLVIAIGIFLILILLIIAGVYAMQTINNIVRPINEIIVIARDGIEDVVNKADNFVDQVVERLPPKGEIAQDIRTGIQRFGQEVRPELQRVAQDLRPAVENIGNKVSSKLSQIRR